MMAVYAAKFPAEKMHIQFDKGLYNREETIWYKIYLISGTQLSALSKNVYVEWYDTSGHMIKQTVAPLYQSTARGSFDIPADYKGNFIHVKAYTRWMLNGDPDFLYQRDLGVNTGKTTAKKVQPITYKTTVETFPEGGNLVEGLNSKIAFKATNQYGYPVFIKGALVGKNNKFIDSIDIKHDGMGFFFLNPQPGEEYAIHWTDENGKSGVCQIPPAKKEGAKIAVMTTNDQAIIQVERSDSASSHFRKMNLLVHMNQNLFFKVALNATERSILNARIPIDQLPTGILQFTLFTDDWVPVAERLVFINNHTHEFNVRFNTPMVNMDKRGKTVFEVYVPDTAFSNLSIAVTDADVVTPDDRSIFSDILLSDDVHGKIHNPAYYLSSDADSVMANLDLVMLTNGWRRFDWDKIRAGQTPDYKYPRETDFMALQGKVYGTDRISTSSPLMLNLIIVGKDSSKHFAFLPVNKDGSFYQNTYYYDTARIFYSFNGNQNLTNVTQVQFNNGLLRQVPKVIRYPYSTRPYLWSDSLAKLKLDHYLQEQEILKKSMAATTLQEVVVQARPKSKEEIMDEKYTTGLFSGGDSYSFDVMDDPTSFGSIDILTYLQSKVPGLVISGSGQNMSVTYRGAVPDLYVNESQSNMDMVQTMSVNDVAMIKVFRPPFFGSAGGGGGGAIAIYTKKGNDAQHTNDTNVKGLENTVLGGYSRFKEFYNPNYEKEPNTSTPDIRTTLYWNPYITTNKQSPRTRIEFFNNDVTKKYRVVLEGVNSEGKMVRIVRTIDHAE